MERPRATITLICAASASDVIRVLASLARQEAPCDARQTTATQPSAMQLGAPACGRRLPVQLPVPECGRRATSQHLHRHAQGGLVKLCSVLWGVTHRPPVQPQSRPRQPRPPELHAAASARSRCPTYTPGCPRYTYTVHARAECVRVHRLRVCPTHDDHRDDDEEDDGRQGD